MDDVKCKQMLDRFLTFYDQASQTPLHKRYELWTDQYAFPYTPPGYQQGQLAKEMIEYAWNRYEQVYDKIQYFDIGPLEVNGYVESIKQILHCTSPVRMTVMFFVGTFETDPFIMEKNQHYTLCFPVELTSSRTRLIQELTRVVHCSQSGLAPSHTRTLGQLIFQEGMAAHTTEEVLEESGMIDFPLCWEQEKCSREPNRVMMNIQPHLHRTDYEALYSFTKGTGASGFEKEANYTGYLIVEHLLEQGRPLYDLARIQNTEVDAIVERSLFSLMNQAYLTQPQE
ncbi:MULTISPECIES: hypothetical protein [Halobacillus]|uniref:DUF2268 domain-containing protein n=2 Tax=Halobacillus TaxID=45667 RepID=A0A3D8VLJ5_9BACI|nr:MULTISPECIES: hypothetical protein [Halobacillus]RDY70215.1 hypothetical protein DXT76_14040 [Halobacillus trueperi]REJ07298.1 hypothetical protein DYE48_16435 [Halobacillus trueperi]SDP24348.1 hypothetical protein SAMN05421677_11468 [Halobacillus aidingensis]